MAKTGRSAEVTMRGQRQAVVLGLDVPLTVRVSPRARRMSLHVDAAARRVELVLPRGVSPERGFAFAAAQRGWIIARLAALPPPVPFAAGEIVPILGVLHRIRIEHDQGAPPVAIRDGEIRVRGRPEHLARRLRDHLAGLARGEFSERARQLAARLDKRIVRVTVRDTKSRWGSCSATGALSFSWRLVLAPDSVVQSVVAHEVAHLVEMNHGPRFWRLVRRLDPDNAASRAWLQRHRSRLLSYG